MIPKTSRAFVSSLLRIKKLELIALFGTIRTSGAMGRYVKKEDFPKLQAITPGAYATDIFLRVDEKRERIIIEDEEIKWKEDFAAYEGGEACGPDIDQGIIDKQYYIDKKPEDTLVLLDCKEDQLVFWRNGIWTIINKHPISNDDFLIPVEVANSVIESARKSLVSTFSQLTKSTPEGQKYECVSSKKLASVLGMEDLYSVWDFHEVTQVMMNTDMKDGPYKLKRNEQKVTISFSLKYKEKTFSVATKDYNIPGYSFEKYKTEIESGFAKWSGTYQEKNADFGGHGSIEVAASASENLYPKSVDVTVITRFNENETERQASHVTGGTNWSISNVGRLYMFSFYQYENGSVGKLSEDWYNVHATHEPGHLMGLGDAYNGAIATSEVEPRDIMWDGAEGKTPKVYISPNDIEMLFLAVLKNKKQYFYTDGKEKIISDAITIKPEV